MEESVFFDGVRGLFSVLDRGIYGIVTILYNIIETLARTEIIKADAINGFTNKIYALIAIFMIFKISFSLINYLVNPDMIADKAKGGGVLIKNILITFILVIFVPFGFNMLYQLQNAILSDRIIEKFVYNTESTESGTLGILMNENCDEKATTSNIADYMSLVAFKTFFQIDEQSLTDYPEDFEEIRDAYCRADVSEGVGTASVSNLLHNNKVYSAPHGISVSHYYVVSYTFFISTVVGIVLAAVFLGFCFDIALRSIKLQFLEILAPIPIVSYIDPDKSKNGMFSKWLKEVGATWFSLFIRLISYHFAIYFISLVSDIEWDENSIWINLLMIIGILMFAKQLPKLLENIMGIKASGSFNLNPLKKINDNVLGAKAITGFGAGAIGAVGGGIAGGIAGAYAGAAGRGTLLGIANGFKNGKADAKHAFSSGMAKTYKNLTGNDMANLTMSKVLMGMGNKAENSVNEVKGSLKTARSRLNSANTRLSQASYHNQLSSEKLRKMGISPNDLGSAKTNALNNLSALSTKSEKLKGNMINTKKELDNQKYSYENTKKLMEYQLKAPIPDSKRSEIRAKYEKEMAETEKIMAKLQSEYDNENNKYNSIMQEFNKYNEIVSEINSYTKTAEEENCIRSEISRIEKEISTLSDEKKQRERFYQYDSSPKTSVEEAMKNNPSS